MEGVVHDEAPRGHIEEYDGGMQSLTSLPLKLQDSELTPATIRNAVHHVPTSAFWRQAQHGCYGGYTLPD